MIYCPSCLDVPGPSWSCRCRMLRAGRACGSWIFGQRETRPGTGWRLFFYAPGGTIEEWREGSWNPVFPSELSSYVAELSAYVVLES